MERQHICNHTDGSWALVAVEYFSTRCVIERYEYADPPRSVHFLFTYVSVSFLLLFSLFLCVCITLLLRRLWILGAFVNDERTALLSVHPPDYWRGMVGDANPFRSLFPSRST